MNLKEGVNIKKGTWYPMGFTKLYPKSEINRFSKSELGLVSSPRNPKPGTRPDTIGRGVTIGDKSLSKVKVRLRLGKNKVIRNQETNLRF